MNDISSAITFSTPSGYTGEAIFFYLRIKGQTRHEQSEA
jgi:hypothetical protein